MSAATSTPVETRRALWAACSILTGRDADGATIDNGVGWDGQDTRWGHRVVEAMSPETWTDDVAADAYTTLRKYRRQLAEAGVDYDELPAPVVVDGGAGTDTRARSRDAAREAERNVRQLDYVDGRFVARSGYDPDLVGAQRRVPGRRWDARSKVNTFPLSSAPQVADLAADYGFDITPAARVALDEGPAEPGEPVPELTIDEAAGLFVFEFEYDPNRKDLVADLPGRKFVPGRKVWTAPVEGAARVAEIAGQFVVDPACQARLDEIVAEHAHAHALSSALDSDFEPEGLTRFDEFGNPHELYPYQRAGVEYAVMKRRVLIGDEQGLGKTMQALAAVLHEQAFPAVVVCPLNPWTEWQEAFARWSARPLRIVGLEGRAHRDVGVPVGDVYVVNEAVIGDYTVKGERHPGWATILAEAVRPAALIVDESQAFKNPAAERTRSLARLAASLPDEAMRILCTGTAIENRPYEVVPQLDIMGTLDRLGGERGFKFQYLGGKKTGMGTAESRKRLHDDLRRVCMIRRNEHDALPDLPPKTRSVLELPAGALDPTVMAEYRDVEGRVVDYLEGLARQLAEQQADDPGSVTDDDVAAAMDAAVRAAAAEVLVEYGKLRALTGLAKVPAALAEIGTPSTDDPVVVFAHHKPVVNALVAGLGAARIDGSVNARDRGAIVKAFQRGEHRAIVIATRAGGTGITLTRSARTYTVEWDWNPARHAQAEKRNHRIGQQRPVSSVYIDGGDETFDPTMREIVMPKFEAMEQTLADRPGDRWADDDSDAERGSIADITRRFLDNVESR